MLDLEIMIVQEEPVEYLCSDCKQLRLSLRGVPSKCGNCESEHIVTGAPGTLEKPDA